MGINQVPIVNQYSDINRRMVELAQERQSPRFALPTGVAIISRHVDRNDLALANLVFVLRERSLILLKNRDSDTLVSARGQSFLGYLLQFCPNLKYSSSEIVLTKDEADWLAKALGLDVNSG